MLGRFGIEELASLSLAYLVLVEQELLLVGKHVEFLVVAQIVDSKLVSAISPNICGWDRVALAWRRQRLNALTIPMLLLVVRLDSVH